MTSPLGHKNLTGRYSTSQNVGWGWPQLRWSLCRHPFLSSLHPRISPKNRAGRSILGWSGEKESCFRKCPLKRICTCHAFSAKLDSGAVRCRPAPVQLGAFPLRSSRVNPDGRTRAQVELPHSSTSARTLGLEWIQPKFHKTSKPASLLF